MSLWDNINVNTRRHTAVWHIGSNDTQPWTRKFPSFFFSCSINTTVKGHLNITAVERPFLYIATMFKFNNLEIKNVANKIVSFLSWRGCFIWIRHASGDCSEHNKNCVKQSNKNNLVVNINWTIVHRKIEEGYIKSGLRSWHEHNKFLSKPFLRNCRFESKLIIYARIVQRMICSARFS